MAAPPPNKMRKTEPIPTVDVIVQFADATGATTGGHLSVPGSVTPQQLETLLNGMLHEEGAERTPYSFFVEDLELGEELAKHLVKHSTSAEKVLKITYRPQALFRVRPVVRCSATMSGHAEAVLAVSFSPDGRRLASGSGDSTVRFWDLNTQLPLHVGKSHTSWVLVVSWSPDAALLASGDRAGGVTVWDPAKGVPVGQCRGHKGFVTSIVWEPAHVELPSRRFATGSKDATVRVWDASTRRCLFTLGSHTAAVTALAWGGQGNLISAGRDRAIHVWDVAKGVLVRSLSGHAHWVNCMSLSTAYALRTGAFDHTGRSPASPDAAKAAARKRYEVALGAGGAERLATGSDDFTMFLWEPTHKVRPLARMTGHNQLVNHVTFSPDGRWIASASFDKSVRLWDGERGTFVATLRGHVGAVYQLAWSADSRLLVSASRDSTIKLWEVRTRKMLEDLPGHADEVFAVDWSPNGASVASGGKDKVLKLWRQ